MTRYSKIPSQLFSENRQRLAQQLAPNAIAVLNANDIMPTNADGTMKFHQNSDLFYCSGIDQEETILVLYPDAPIAAWREILFIRKTDAHIKAWEGEKHSQESAKEVSGIESIYWLDSFHNLFKQLADQASTIYLNSNEHGRADRVVQTRDDRFTQWCKSTYPLHHYERLAPIMHLLRAVKGSIEIELIRQACEITKAGFEALMRQLKPGVMEYELEATLIHEFTRRRSKGFAYEPIIASGQNACILHYVVNNQMCQSGDMVLLDVGAEYANYKSDMTRVLPVNGRFSKRQRAVYKAVLRVMREAQKLLVAGNDLPNYNEQVGAIMTEELIGLGLLDRMDVKNENPKYPAYKKYFMHGTSHHIGLDTHDVGNTYRTLEPGMVLTIEPGIYIPEEAMGIRLENTFVIRDNGAEDLMADIPIEIDAIESILAEYAH